MKTGAERSLAGHLTLVACLATEVFLAGCGSSTPPISPARLERAATSDTRQKLQNSNKLLLDSLQKPTAPFHFSYKAQENINTKYPMDKTAKPVVGPVEFQADVSPDEIDVTSVRGKEKNEHKAKKTDQLAWGMAELELVGPVAGTGIVLAVGQIAARPAGSDTVGGVAADKYDFDTSTVTGPTKAGLDIAKGMLNIQSTKGTVWVENSTGKLVKFNIDADFADQKANSWKEHYEGEVTPK